MLNRGKLLQFLDQGRNKTQAFLRPMLAPLRPAVNKICHPQLMVLIRLMRLDKPIGIYLLLWPMLWALWIAAEGFPDSSLLIIFILGAVLMRSAGCVINDFADRNWDGDVERTQNRPMVTGQVSVTEAILLCMVLCLTAFILVMMTDKQTIYLSFGAVALASLYPFMKRYTYFPQVFLGAAFAWGVPMAFSAQLGELPRACWLLYAITLVWTVAYDTLYAMVDRDDDLKVGIKSTAILFGEADKLIVGFLQALVIVALVLLGQQLAAGVAYYCGIGAAALLFGYQQYLIRNRDRGQCFQAFLDNHWVGAVVFAGILVDYAIAS